MIIDFFLLKLGLVNASYYTMHHVLPFPFHISDLLILFFVLTMEPKETQGLYIRKLHCETKDMVLFIFVM